MNCILQTEHQVLYHQHIAETVLCLHLRKPDPDPKKWCVGDFLFLLIEFLGLAVL